MKKFPTLSIKRALSSFALALMPVTVPLVASAQAQTFSTFSTVSTIGGLWLLNNTTGHVSYCNPSIGIGTGNPTGVCARTGGVALSAAGYFFGPMGNNTSSVVIVSKTNGAIYQCSVVLLNGTSPIGSCVAISTTATLN